MHKCLNMVITLRLYKLLDYINPYTHTYVCTTYIHTYIAPGRTRHYGAPCLRPGVGSNFPFFYYATRKTATKTFSQNEVCHVLTCSILLHNLNACMPVTASLNLSRLVIIPISCLSFFCSMFP